MTRSSEGGKSDLGAGWCVRADWNMLVASEGGGKRVDGCGCQNGSSESFERRCFRGNQESSSDMAIMDTC